MNSLNIPHRYVYIGIGSNIEPEINILKSLILLKEYLNIINISPVFVTSPIGVKEKQPHFYNCVVETKLKKELTPFELKFNILRNIEKQLNRIRFEDKYAPRTIDLDILLFEDVIINTKELTIPDPDILTRDFLFAGLLYLNPDIIIYPQNVSLSLMAYNYEIDKLNINYSFTEKLRKELIDEH